MIALTFVVCGTVTAGLSGTSHKVEFFVKKIDIRNGWLKFSFGKNQRLRRFGYSALSKESFKTLLPKTTKSVVFAVDFPFGEFDEL